MITFVIKLNLITYQIGVKITSEKSDEDIFSPVVPIAKWLPSVLTVCGHGNFGVAYFLVLVHPVEARAEKKKKG